MRIGGRSVRGSESEISAHCSGVAHPNVRHLRLDLGDCWHKPFDERRNLQVVMGSEAADPNRRIPIFDVLQSGDLFDIHQVGRADNTLLHEKKQGSSPRVDTCLLWMSSYEPAGLMNAGRLNVLEFFQSHDRLLGSFRLSHPFAREQAFSYSGTAVALVHLCGC
jgi:hypothetical protein